MWCNRVWLASLVAMALWLSYGEPGRAQLQELRKSLREAEEARAPAPMVAVPAGSFVMGRDGREALEDERPGHEVWLDAFEIDQHEVTTAQYAAFLHETAQPPPVLWETVDLTRHGAKPVVGVSWEDASLFCAWAGKQLPSEAQWEKAARGTDGRRYPWGNSAPTSKRANFALGARFSYDLVLFPVGRFPSGASPYGAQDMAGSVWEWVRDWYDGAYYATSPSRNPTGPEGGQFKVLRGGSWSDLPKYLLAYSRFKLPPSTRNSFTGFRCAKPVSSTP
ncbi:sulfatase modifying factor 2 [Nitrospira sp.]|nr:sulfatase modifying factor 2 [Nitrospira sp.]